MRYCKLSKNTQDQFIEENWWPLSKKIPSLLYQEVSESDITPDWNSLQKILQYLQRLCIYIATGFACPQRLSCWLPRSETGCKLTVWSEHPSVHHIWKKCIMSEHMPGSQVVLNYNPSFTAEPICCPQRLCLCSSSCEIHNVILEIKWLVTVFQVPEWWAEKLVKADL